MGEAEIKYVQEAFETNWIAPLGPHVDAFEKTLTDYLQTGSVAALSSGTAALHLALQLLDIKKGDYVICQDLTFAASAFPIIYCGAEPVFVDSETDTWNMSPELLREAIHTVVKKGKKPAAIIIVDLYGMPAKIDELLSIAAEYAIPVIEDSAEALGSLYKGNPCGSFGEFSILSFNGNKIITTSGGGALAGKDIALIKKARFLSTQAKQPVPYYLHHQIGYNYRLSNVLAGIGRGQMEILPQRVERRREIYNLYRNALEGVEGISFNAEPEGCFSNRWLTTILVDSSKTGGITNEDIRLQLESKNIESRFLWKPMHQQPVFEQYLFIGNGVSSHLFAQGLCLPSGSNLSNLVIETVIKEIKLLLNADA